MAADSLMPADEGMEQQVSLADLFLHASQSLARSDARLYRSVDRHLSRSREILRLAEAITDELPLKPAERSLRLLLGTPSFERQTRKSLEALCREHGVRGYSRMSKVTMIHRLQEAGVTSPPVPLEALSKAELLSMLRDFLSSQEKNG